MQTTILPISFIVYSKADLLSKQVFTKCLLTTKSELIFTLILKIAEAILQRKKAPFPHPRLRYDRYCAFDDLGEMLVDCTSLMAQTDNMKSQTNNGEQGELFACHELLQQAFSLENRLIAWYAAIKERTGEPTLWADDGHQNTPIGTPAQAGGNALQFSSLSAAQIHTLYWSAMLLVYQILDDLQEIVNQDLLSQSQPSPCDVESEIETMAPRTPESFVLSSTSTSLLQQQQQQQQEQETLTLYGPDQFMDMDQLYPYPYDPTMHSLSLPLTRSFSSFSILPPSPCPSTSTLTSSSTTPATLSAVPLSTSSSSNPIIPDLPYQYASLICQSVRYCVDPAMKALGARLVLFPLLMARGYFGRKCHFEMQMWCCEMLHVLVDSGIGCAADV